MKTQEYKLIPCKDATNQYVFHIPCLIGDTVWGFKKINNKPVIVQGKVSEITFVGPDMDVCIVIYKKIRGRWGVNIFETRAEVEDALSKLYKVTP